MLRFFFCFTFFIIGGCTTTIKSIDTHRTAYESYAPYCGSYPSKEFCDDGDMTLFSGLLCLSGDQRGCQGVKDAQSADGRWWRSPRRTNENLGHPNAFSRDMSLGVLAYLVQTKDEAAAKKWMSWIDRNRPCVVKLFGSCRVRGFHRLCKNDEDFRCSITPELWAVIAEVWEHNNWSTTPTMRLYRNTPDVPISENLKGYELHLKGVKAFIRQKMGKKICKVADELVDQESWNPFFRYLKEGPSEAVKEAMVEVCPLSQPAERRQWSWERRGYKEPWVKSMGWDCIFMSNLLRI